MIVPAYDDWNDIAEPTALEDTAKVETDTLKSYKTRLDALRAQHLSMMDTEIHQCLAFAYDDLACDMLADLACLYSGLK